MIGIERLYKLIADIDVSAAPELWYILRWGTEGDWDCEEHDGKTLSSALTAIANQIEREQGGRVSRMRVLAVVMDMERHCLGHEGMEDSPVARWARELRAALGGDRRDHAADVSVSACDLLPQEDRETIAWVREHGGLEEVEAHWSGRVPLTSVKRMVALHKAKRERLKAHALGLERKCADLGETIRELSGKAAKQSDEIRVMRDVIVETCARLGVEGTGSTVDDAQVIWREISRRLMPKGMEWPTFESGEPVMLGDSVTECVAGGEFEVRSIEFRDGVTYLREGFRTEGIVIVRPCERVKRPAPKVLDADGVEIREGDRVWSTQLDEPHEWIVINPHEDRGYAQTVLVSIGDRTGHARPENLTHRAPVLAADGKPLLKHETVYEIKTGERYFVTNVFDGMTEPDFPEHTVECRKHDDVVTHMFEPSQLTHERPVLAADWKPLEVGQTVYATHYGYAKCTVLAIEWVVDGYLVEVENEGGHKFRQAPDEFTHQRPDTWQRIEEDAKKEACAYFGVESGGYGCSECPVKQWEESCDEVKSRDLVRRAKKLAGVDND